MNIICFKNRIRYSGIKERSSLGYTHIFPFRDYHPTSYHALEHRSRRYCTVDIKEAQFGQRVVTVPGYNKAVAGYDVEEYNSPMRYRCENISKKSLSLLAKRQMR